MLTMAWPEIVDIELWTFAFRHIVTKWNNTPRPDLEYKTPDEVFSGVKRVNNEENHFADFHPFGIPVYVLDDRLQAKKKIPKWEPRSRVGVYLGQSKEHESNVSYVLNTKKGTSALNTI